MSERIDSYIDIIAITKETDAFKSQIESLEKAKERLASIRISGISDSTKQTVLEIKEIDSALNNLDNTEKKIIKTKKELTKEEIAGKEAIRQRTAEIKNQVREEGAAKGSLEQRRAALIRLTKEYDNLSAAERESAQGQRLQGVVSGLTTQVKGLEEATGRAQRNVGNYTNSIVEAGKKAFGAIRLAANILPGLGLSGAFLLIFEGLKGIIEQTGLLTSRFNKLKDSADLLKEISAAANESASKELVTSRLLFEEAANVNISLVARKAAIKELRETYPAYLKNLSDEQILAGDTADAENRLRDAILGRAKAQAATEKLIENEKKILDLEEKREAVRVKAEDARVKARKEQSSLLNDKTGSEAAAFRQTNTQNTYNNLLKEGAGIQKDINALNDKNALLTKVVLDNTDKTNKLTIPDKDKKGNHIKTIAEAVAELRKELQAIDFEKAKGIITFDEADQKSAEKYKSTIEEIFKLPATQSDKLKASTQLSLELNPISLRILERQIEDFKNKTEKDREISIKPPEGAKKALQDETKAYEDEIKRRLASNAIAEAKEEQIVIAKYAKNKLSKEDYEKALLDIKQKYVQLNLKAQIEELQHEYDFAFKGVEQAQEVADKKLEIEKKIAELKRDLDKNDVENTKKTTAEKLKALEDFITSFQSRFNDVADIIGGAINASVIAEKNAIQDKEDQQQKNYEQELARLNSLTTTTLEQEQIKADKIKTLEATRAAQKEQNDRRQKEADIRKAKFDKAQAVANIVFNTALAVVKALPNFVLAAIVGAIGAAQLAVAIATPLPRYKDGKLNNYEGFAWVGDGGKSEAIVRADGSIERTPATDTLTYLGAKDKVFPDYAAFTSSIAKGQTDKVLSASYQPNELAVLFKDTNRKLDIMNRTLAKRPSIKNNITVKGDFRNSDYIQKNVKGL